MHKVSFAEKDVKPSLMTVDTETSRIIIFDESAADNTKISSSPLTDAFAVDGEMELILNASGVVVLKAIDPALQGGSVMFMSSILSSFDVLIHDVINKLN
jgi:hypothetical protein